ncbi:hypothetical protein PTSG_09764 [Salpingoeca rosetta]|uniref:HORMA domain-containing protein n=1 Tax=Salpingoeca rosetta (strain ATCC 50818 / BSB-021) TaxID=946362 RepID=F2UNZ5_SALR5|nr:uncharacterized protein PTSG_09764 [Salpingoeca rosetta]EGD79350.1 hypothetical protein PTSG_09764 [Salpingoeca rosetta]|eukprot:XP_004989119.1 hypothetical protein PTSG_09764 [Salpingoeca rosetta]
MALAQRTRVNLSTSKARTETRQQTGTFSALFPEQGIKDATLSAHCMKKLLVVGVSSIAYLRNMFPNSAFGDRAIEDMSLKILRERSQSPEACQVVAWLKNIFPAIENRYVNKVVVGVYDGSADAENLTQDDLIEAHTFKFGSINQDDYIKITTSKNQTLKLPTSAEFKANTLGMLRTLLMATQTLDKLPEVCLLALKVYYDESVPEDFTLEGFEEATGPHHQSSNSGGGDPFSVPRQHRVKIDVGGTATHHDALKVYVQTNKNRFETTADCDEDEEDGNEVATDADDAMDETADAANDDSDVSGSSNNNYGINNKKTKKKDEAQRNVKTNTASNTDEREGEEDQEEPNEQQQKTQTTTTNKRSGSSKAKAKTKTKDSKKTTNTRDPFGFDETLEKEEKARSTTTANKSKSKSDDGGDDAVEDEGVIYSQEKTSNSNVNGVADDHAGGGAGDGDGRKRAHRGGRHAKRSARDQQDDDIDNDINNDNDKITTTTSTNGEDDEDGADGSATPPSKKANLLLSKKKKSAAVARARQALPSITRASRTSTRTTRASTRSSKGGTSTGQRDGGTGTRATRKKGERVLRATAQKESEFDAYEFCDSQDETGLQLQGKRSKRRSTVVKRPVRVNTRTRTRS